MRLPSRRCTHSLVVAAALLASPISVTWSQETAPQSPIVYTNRQNVRRITVGPEGVAFATSGGVRLWEKQTKRWREWTMRDGLPSDNVLNVAFEQAPNPSGLWVLSGDWSVAEIGPSGSAVGRLYLSYLPLSSGAAVAVTNEPPSPPAPAGGDTHSMHWADYGLRLSGNTAIVYGAGRIPALAFDRTTRTWTTYSALSGEPRPLAPRKPSQDEYGFGWLQAAQRVARNDGGETWLLQFNSGLFVCDSHAPTDGSPVFVSFPWPQVYVNGTPDPITLHSPIFHARTENSPSGAVAFDIVEQKQYAGNSIGVLVEHSWRVTYRFDPRDAKPVLHEVLRQRLTGSDLVRLLKDGPEAQRESNLLHDGRLTDIAVEPAVPGDSGGEHIWCATYEGTTGIACFDVSTRKWSYPDQGGNGIPANDVTGIHRLKNGQVMVETTGGSSVYDAQTDTWKAAPHQPELVDPDKPYSWSWTAWDPLVQKHPDLNELVVSDLRLRGNDLWLLGRDTNSTPGAPGSTVVVRWNRLTDVLTRYHNPAWIGPAFSHPPNQPGANFYEGAGALWIFTGSALFRYDSVTDRWRQELAGHPGDWTLAAYPEGLWVQLGRNYANPYSETKADGNASFFLWRVGDTAWSRLDLPDSGRPFAGVSLWAANGDIWLGGLGLLRLPQDTARFVPVAEEK